MTPKLNAHDLESDALPFLPTSIHAAVSRLRNPELRGNSIPGEFEPNSADILLPPSAPPKSFAEREADSRMYDESIAQMHVPGSFPSDDDTIDKEIDEQLPSYNSSRTFDQVISDNPMPGSFPPPDYTSA